MKIAPFATETFFARYEFTTPHLLCTSDCETLSVDELLALAGRSTAEMGSLRLGYTESPGGVAVRTAVARQYDTISPADVTLVNAPEEGIYLTMRTLLEPGDHVVVLTPAYDSLRQLAEHITGNVAAWPLQPTETGWALDLARLDALLKPETKLLVVNFPHNPTGFLPTEGEMTAVIERARALGITVLADEMYRGLEFASATLPSFGDRYEKAIVLGGLSKTHGLPGLRVGWLLIKDADFRERLQNWKHYTTICPPGPTEWLAEVALSVADQLAERSRAIVRDNVALADAFFARWPALFHWRRPQAASVALVGIDVPSATAYCQQLAAEAGVLLLPATSLGYDDKHVRFGLGRRAFGASLSHYEAHLRVASAA